MRTNFEIDENNHLSLTIVDAEGDEVNCDFNYDECVNINTDGLEYITLSKENLEELLTAINESERYYDDLSDEEWDDMN